MGNGTSLGSVGPPGGRPATGPKLGYRIMKKPPCTKMVHKFTALVHVHQIGAQLERRDVSERLLTSRHRAPLPSSA